MKAPPKHHQKSSKSTKPCRYLPDATETTKTSPTHHQDTTTERHRLDTAKRQPRHHLGTTKTQRRHQDCQGLPILIVIEAPLRHHRDTTKLHKSTIKTTQKHHLTVHEVTQPRQHRQGTTETPSRHHQDTTGTPPRCHRHTTGTRASREPDGARPPLKLTTPSCRYWGVSHSLIAM